MKYLFLIMCVYPVVSASDEIDGIFKSYQSLSLVQKFEELIDVSQREKDKDYSDSSLKLIREIFAKEVSKAYTRYKDITEDKERKFSILSHYWHDGYFNIIIKLKEIFEERTFLQLLKARNYFDTPKNNLKQNFDKNIVDKSLFLAFKSKNVEITVFEWLEALLKDLQKYSSEERFHNMPSQQKSIDQCYQKISDQFNKLYLAFKLPKAKL